MCEGVGPLGGGPISRSGTRVEILYSTLYKYIVRGSLQSTIPRGKIPCADAVSKGSRLEFILILVISGSIIGAYISPSDLHIASPLYLLS